MAAWYLAKADSSGDSAKASRRALDILERCRVLIAAAKENAQRRGNDAQAEPLTASGEFPDPVEVTLPRGERPSFALAVNRKDATSATAGVIKDAGDDPDVTHGALVLATVRAGAPGAGW